ncbi:MAG: hypothetical protein NUV75_01855 [Gallionella sp.]|nr:hypothetical protein [Gallionella sp.]
MTTQITANIPARKTYQARTEVFNQDDQGRWTSPEIGSMSQAEVIDVCRKASNWTEIKAAHFPMHGFSS